MVMWVITEIVFDALWIAVCCYCISNKSAWMPIRVFAIIPAIVLTLDLIGIVDYTVWKFLTM